LTSKSKETDCEGGARKEGANRTTVESRRDAMGVNWKGGRGREKKARSLSPQRAGTEKNAHPREKKGRKKVNRLFIDDGNFGLTQYNAFTTNPPGEGNNSRARRWRPSSSTSKNEEEAKKVSPGNLQRGWGETRRQGTLFYRRGGLGFRAGIRN